MEYKGKPVIHFERSPPDGECYRRAIEVEGQKGVPFEREQRGGQKKEAAGSYRSRSLEGVPAEREQRAGRRRKQQEAIEVEVGKGSQPKESCGGGGREGKEGREEWGRRRNLTTPL